MTRAADQRVLGEIAESQWGLVSTRQAETAGVHRLQLSRLAKAGLLQRLSQGVYRIAGVPEPEHQAILAAWVALAEPGAPRTDLVVGGVAASQLHGIGQFWMREIDLLLPTRRRTRRDGVRLRVVPVAAREIVVAHGVPTLSPARTIADLLQLGESPDTVADAAWDAVYLGMVSEAETRAAVGAQDVGADSAALFTIALDERLQRQR